ncbi:hypothetical protein, partial [Microcystis sp. M62BS1]
KILIKIAIIKSKSPTFIKQLFLLVNILHDSVQISKMAYHYYRITTEKKLAITCQPRVSESGFGQGFPKVPEKR